MRRFDYGERIPAAALSPAADLVLVGTYGARLTLLDALTGEVVRELLGHRGIVLSVCFSPDARRATSSSGNGNIYLWDVKSGSLLQTLCGHTASAAMRFSPEGRYLISGSADRSLRLWDLASGQQLAIASLNTQGTNTLAVSPDGQYALTGGGEYWDEVKRGLSLDGDYSIRLWKLSKSLRD